MLIGTLKILAENISKNISGKFETLLEFVIQTFVPPNIVIVANVTTNGVIFKYDTAIPFIQPINKQQIIIIIDPIIGSPELTI